MATTVILWENNFLPGGRCSEHHWWGHAAMQIGDWPYFEDCDVAKTVESYVSWWPDWNKDTTGPFSLQPGKSTGIVHDILSEKYLPDHFVRLNTSKLQEDKMIAYWKGQRSHGGKHWRKYRKNCATMVAKVIYAGGITTSMWHDHSFFWTPNKVRQLALEAFGAVVPWKTIEQELQKAGYRASDWCGINQARDRRFCSSGAPCKFGSSPASPSNSQAA